MRRQRQGRVLFASDLAPTLRIWDSAGASTRHRILQKFVRKFEQQAAPEIEEKFSAGASLLFTRITTNLRLTYSLGSSVLPHLNAIRVFMRSTSGSRFLHEFMSIGGLLTLLDIVSQQQDVCDDDRQCAFCLLQEISRNNHESRALICESNGVKLAKKAMESAVNEATQRSAGQLLCELGKANDDFAAAAVTALIAIVRGDASISCKKMAVQILREVLSLSDVSSASLCQINSRFVRTIVNLFLLNDLEIHYESAELLKFFVRGLPQSGLTETTIELLVNFLNSHIDISTRPKAEGEHTWTAAGGHAASTSAFTAKLAPQACAAKTLRDLARHSSELCSLIVHKDGVRGLIYCFVDFSSYEAQQIAYDTLRVLADASQAYSAEIAYYMGLNLYSAFSNQLQGGKLFRVFSDGMRALVQKRISQPKGYACSHTKHEQEKVDSPPSLSASAQDDDGQGSVSDASSARGNTVSDDADQGGNASEDSLDSAPGDADRSDIALQRIHHRMTSWHRSAKQALAASRASRDAAAAGGSVSAAAHAKATRSKRYGAPIIRRMTAEANRQAQVRDSLKFLQQQQMHFTPLARADDIQEESMVIWSKEQRGKSRETKDFRSQRLEAARKRFVKRVDMVNHSIDMVRRSWSGMSGQSHATQSESSQILFAPLAIPNMGASTVLFTQRAGRDEDGEAQRPEETIQLYSEFKKIDVHDCLRGNLAVSGV